jgi:hypothetical protein
MGFVRIGLVLAALFGAFAGFVVSRSRAAADRVRTHCDTIPIGAPVDPEIERGKSNGFDVVVVPGDDAAKGPVSVTFIASALMARHLCTIEVADGHVHAKRRGFVD